ncbi:MAG: efflux RND transporter permease subunit [Candidatus Omnitrophica bacterium]|nr:efflux RND transporter permease subunit [Candidatus Omnitrophota bacterium]
MRLPEFGVRFPITNLMIFFAILVLGLFSLSRLPIDLMPEIEPPVISVITVYEGAGAEDVESKVTEIVENNLATVSNLDKITSRSLEGLSVVSCRFNWGTNLDEASNDVRDKLEFAKRTLPEEIDTPIVFKFNTSMIPILFIGANADRSYSQLYHIIDKQLADYLKRIPGVGSVQIMGALERQINIKIDRFRLEGYHLSAQQIVDRLAQENITLPAGDLKMGYLDYTLRVPGEFTDPSQINDIILTQQDNKIVYMKDVASVEDSFKEETMIVRSNGKSGLMLLIQKRSGANTVEVANKVKRALENVGGRLPKDVKLLAIMDSSEHITQSIKDLTQTVYWGGLFVILVVYFFLRQIRSSLIIALSIPFSLIIAFIFMYLMGYTINIMSLSSLAIAIGMVVDNAIVVVDNVMRHRENGEKPNEAAVFGTSEVGLAVSASTFTTVVVFLPMVFLTGITGIMFKQIAIMITVTLLASLFTALTFSVTLCSKLLTHMPTEKFRTDKKTLYQRFYETSGRYFEYIESKYSAVLGWSLRHKKITVFIAIAIFIFSILLIPKIGTEFLPEEDTGDLQVQVELPVGTRVEETDKAAKKVENIFRENIPEMINIFARSGQSSSGRFGAVFGGRIGPNILVVGAKLVKVDKRTRSVKEIGEEIRPKIQALPGVKKITITAGSPFSRLLFGGGKPISVEILGNDFVTTDDIAYKMKAALENIKGVVDITISREIGTPELQVEVDRIKASSLGLSMAQITDTLRTYFYGNTASKYREAGDEYDIFVRLQDADRTSISDIEDIPLVSASGVIIRLNNIARIVHKTGPIEIERQNQERIVKVEANTFRRSLGDVANDIRAVIKRMSIPEDISINLGSDVEEQMKAFRDLFVLFLLGALLVYMVMAAQFESLLDPFIVMFSVPFAFTGVAFGLFFGGVTLSVVSFLGLVMLVGIVVNNAIVLVDYINILRARGLSMYDAITKGGANRLRPVLMTTITTLFGMLPLALSRGEGSELWRPLGVSMIGGLSISTLITLVLVPVIYAIFKERQKRKI